MGLAGGFFVGAVASWIKIGNVNGNADLKRYRMLFPPASDPGGTSNVCADARAGRRIPCLLKVGP